MLKRVLTIGLATATCLMMLAACGKSKPINADSGKKTEENVNDQISDNSDDRDDSNNSVNVGDAENKQLGGVSFEIIDSATLRH